MFDLIPAERRQGAEAAAREALGAVSAVQQVTGGASGALLYRLEAGGRDYLLRLERPPDIMRDPARWYPCMTIAAEAGVGPQIRYADPGAGVAIMDFVPNQPLAEFPGGPLALARAQGELIARLQATDLFPPLRDYPELLAGMLEYLRVCGRYRPELFAPHAEGLARIREAYPWDSSALVSSHNDPNPGNFLFDGQRLWLIDWETAFRNDPLADIAILVDDPSVGPEQQAALLQAWLGRTPDTAMLARLRLMRQMTRLYYGALMLSVAAPAHSPEEDLTALTLPELQAAAAEGRIAVGPLETLLVVGKAVLARFLGGFAEPGFDEAVAVARAG